MLARANDLFTGLYTNLPHWRRGGDRRSTKAKNKAAGPAALKKGNTRDHGEHEACRRSKEAKSRGRAGPLKPGQRTRDHIAVKAGFSSQQEMRRVDKVMKKQAAKTERRRGTGSNQYQKKAGAKGGSPPSSPKGNTRDALIQRMISLSLV